MWTVETLFLGSSMECVIYYKLLKKLKKEENVLSTKAMEQLSKYYTTDVSFIKDNQKLLKQIRFKDQHKDLVNNGNNLNKIIEIWKEIKEDTGFKEKYHYVDFPYFEFLK